MQTNSPPEIDQAELKAVRDFLNMSRDDLPIPPAPRGPRQASSYGHVTVRHGITLARNRSTLGKTEA